MVRVVRETFEYGDEYKDNEQTMRLLIASHSYAHFRQQLFQKELSKYCEVLSVAPRTWTIGLSLRQVRVLEGINIKLLNTTVPQDWMNSTFLGLENVAKSFKPDWLWMVEEPQTFFALQGLEIAKEIKCKYAVFTWENIFKNWAAPYRQIEQRVLKEADIIIVGNKEAKECLEKKHADKDKIKVMPMVGIDTELFKPMNSEKAYNSIYVGNLLPWKGCPYIDYIVRDLGKKHLWVGEGPYVPMYGDRYGYGDYLELYKFYNQATKFAVHFSLPTPEWKEQFNYVSCEALACGLPVIVENSRVMKEIFSGCPGVFFVKEGSVRSLRSKMKLLSDIDETILRRREDETMLKMLGQKGREYIEEHYSNKVIVKELLKCLRKK